MSNKDYANYLLEAAKNAGIQNPKELANFMGQMQIESGGYTHMNESMHYRPERLLEVFPGRNGMNDVAKAKEIVAGGPESIANAIYGGQWGKTHLGNVEPGDGWKFHGRGYVQLTGRDNYAIVGKALGLDLVNHPELAADRDIASKIAIHYWETRVVPHSHQQDVKGACHDINGGEKGLPERRVVAEEWEHTLTHVHERDGQQMSAAPHSEPSSKTHHEQHATPAPRQDADSTSAHDLQRQLSMLGYTDAHGHPLPSHGQSDLVTKHAVESFQFEHGLKVDGIAGPKTMHTIEEALAKQHAQLPMKALLSLDDPSHSAYPLFKQNLQGVEQLNAEHGIAGALTVDAAARGMTHVDRVLTSEDGSRLFAVQSHGDLLKEKFAAVDTVMAINTPLEHSSAQWSQAVQQHAHSITQQSQQQSQQRQAPVQGVPSISLG
jgi:putative chitinase